MRFDRQPLRITCFVLFALLTTSLVALAEVPRETIERIAEIRVEEATAWHLNKIGKLTNQERYQRTEALHKEAVALWEPYRRSPQPEAEATIEGLSKSKLALLTPQWQKEQQDAQHQNEQREKETGIALEQDARRALEFQRQRLVLQKQIGDGTIDQDSYEQKDRAAATGIADLRKRYETAGGIWPQKFDTRLELLTRALNNNSTTVIPQPQVQTGTGEGTGGGHAPDFNHDVKLAAGILVKEQENAFRFDRKEISSDTFREALIVYQRDRATLRARYEAISRKRGEQFENAYINMAAPALHALKVKYYPGQYAPAPTGQQAKPVTPPPEPETGMTWRGITIWVLIGIGVFGLIAWFKREKPVPLPEYPQLPPTSTAYGSASWAPEQTTPRSPMSTAQGVFFGKSSLPWNPRYSDAGKGAPITSRPEVHTLIVARTRAGKGTRVLVPTLLRYDSSMLVIDPKGENAAITARTRRDQLGHTVHIVNPWGELEGHYEQMGFTCATYNPLDAIDRTDPNAVAVAQSLAATICPITDPKERYWQGSAANVLAAVFLWISDSPTEEKTLARARHIITRSRADFKKILAQMMASTAYNGAINEIVSQYYDLAEDTYSGIMSGLVENTKFISDPQIKTSTAASSFSLQALRDERITVYIVIPHDRIETHSTWLRLMITSAMQALKARNRNTRPPQHRCMFMIDEFGSLGHIPDLPRDIALMSGYGLDFTLVVQGLDQLEHHYNKAKGTILNNCGYKWFCNVLDLETAKYLSESLGKETVRTKTTSTSTGTSGDRDTSGESTSYGETGRSLLTPEEILTLGKERAILLSPFDDPHCLRPVDYWNLEREFSHLQIGYPKLYWEPPLTYDRNPCFDNR